MRGESVHVAGPNKETWTLARGIRQAVVIAAIMFSALGLYLIVLKWRGPFGRDHVTYIEQWDAGIPFEPAWVWAYLIPYLIGPLVVGTLSSATFTWFIRRGLLLIGITLAIFIVYPTQTHQRPRVPGTDPTARLYRDMVEIDEPPANAAPSLHVSLTCLLAWALVRDYPRWWLPGFIGAVLVWLATLFTRQHHVLDVVTGAALACVLALPWPVRGRGQDKGVSR
jgi:membrane-associated phospholipid phosphatase